MSEVEIEYDCSPFTKSSGFTPLMHAVMRNDILEVRRICQENPEQIDVQNTKGWTALMLACRNSNTCSSYEIVEELLFCGANPNLKTTDGWTALILSSTYTRTDSSEKTVKLLIEYKAEIDAQNNRGYYCPEMEL
jgi:ankyrin repeat protein